MSERDLAVAPFHRDTEQRTPPDLRALEADIRREYLLFVGMKNILHERHPVDFQFQPRLREDKLAEPRDIVIHLRALAVEVVDHERV